MGLYFRKSIRVGLLRFNFSKAGIGVSAGIPGLRIGTGPRGNFVQMGRGGVYYRATLPAANGPARPAHPGLAASAAPLHDPTLGPEQEIESGSVLAMVDDSAAGLLAELNQKRQRLRAAPATAILIGLMLAFSWNAMPPLAQSTLAAFSIGV